jgi:hypothetical protein
MKEKIKYYSNGKKKKEVWGIIKNNHDFKLIINYNLEENISSIMEKPNLKKLEPSILVSGAHVLSNQEQNHCDFFQSGALVFREYPEIKGSTDYGYNISGAMVII